MKYLIGGYTLDNATLQVEETPSRVNNSLLQLRVITHTVQGKLRADTQNELHSKIGGLITALRAGNFASAGLYHDSGAATHHVIQASQTLDGIKLMSGPSFPVGVGAEYSVFRTFQFTLQAELKASAGLDLVNFSETVNKAGGTRPSAWLLPADGSEGIRQRLARIPYTLTQSGSAETYNNYFAYPPPLGEEPDEIQTGTTGPEYSRGKQATYRWNWSYRWTTTVDPGPVLRATDRRT